MQSQIPMYSKLYRCIGPDFKLESCIYISTKSKKVTYKKDGEILSKSEYCFTREWSLSKIMVLTEAELVMRLQIASIHDEMRRHKLSFNPLDTVDFIFVYPTRTKKEVHQYNKITGQYIQSFPGVNIAFRECKPKDSKDYRDGAIAEACKGKRRKSAFGYKWSFVKMNVHRFIC